MIKKLKKVVALKTSVLEVSARPCDYKVYSKLLKRLILCILLIPTKPILFHYWSNFPFLGIFIPYTKGILNKRNY